MSLEPNPQSESAANLDLSSAITRAGQLRGHRSSGLPASLKVLLVSPDPEFSTPICRALREGESSNCRVHFQQAENVTVGLALLRDQSFEVVLLTEKAVEGRLRGIVDSIRAGGSPNQAVIVVGSEPGESLAVSCFEDGADDYVDLTSTTKAGLIWQLARASKWRKLSAENQRLRQNQQQQISRQAEEALARWTEQSNLLGVAELVNRNWPAEELPNLRGYYREVLQAHIIMGSGQAATELERLTEIFVDEQITAQQLMRMHLTVVHEAIHELGDRCARHVMNRADSLVIDLLIRISDGYHRRSTNRLSNDSSFRPSQNAQSAKAGR